MLQKAYSELSWVRTSALGSEDCPKEEASAMSLKVSGSIISEKKAWLQTACYPQLHVK